MSPPTIDRWPFVPGASKVRFLKGRGTEWRCEICDNFINPIFVRQGEAIFPSCRECFYNDLPLLGQEAGGADAIPIAAITVS